MPVCPYCNEEFENSKVLFAAIKEEGDANAQEMQDDTVLRGQWIKDTVYDKFMGKFLFADNTAVHKNGRSIFCVDWHEKKEAAKGVGIPHSDSRNPSTLPVYVELGEEDAKEANVAYLTECFCPKCHSVINRAFLTANEKDICRIAFLGGSRAGKTQYILAAYQNMAAYLASPYELARSFDADEISKNIMTVLTEQLNGYGKISRTDITYIRPVLITLDTETEKKFIVLYDIPGEVFEPKNASHLLEHAGAMKLADSLLIMVDSRSQVFQPLKSDAVKKSKGADSKTQPPETGTSGDDSQQEINSKTENLELESFKEYCEMSLPVMLDGYSTYVHVTRKDEHGGYKQHKNIGIVLTKFDYVIDNLSVSTFLQNVHPEAECIKPEGNLHYASRVETVTETVRTGFLHLRRKDVSRTLKGGVDLNEMKHNSNMLEAMLTHHDDREVILCGSIKQDVQDKLGVEPYLFCVSTYIRGEQTGEKFKACATESLQRHRVLEPILFVLAKEDILPTREYREYE